MLKLDFFCDSTSVKLRLRINNSICQGCKV